MNLLTAVILGVLQGLTEFLPVSSTAHMAVIPQILFNMKDPGAAFSAVVQLGPIVAIVAFFWGDLSRYFMGIVRTGSPANAKNDVDARLGWFTLFGTIPLAVAGLLLEKYIDKEFRSLPVIAGALILLALVMVLAERIGKRDRDLASLTFGEAMIVGFAQILALVPGASRSGVTITSGLFLGLDRESATRFSFLLSIPAITAAGLYKLFKTIKENHGLGPDVVNYIAGAVVAGVVAFLVVKWFLKFMEKGNTYGFIIYRIAFGALILGLYFTHRIG